jgi:hypothetical protein
MTLTIDPSKLSGLTAIVTRLNSVEGAEQITAESYLLARVNEILDSYTQQELDRIKEEATPLFDLAATLPVEAQEQVKTLIQQLASQ